MLKKENFLSPVPFANEETGKKSRGENKMSRVKEFMALANKEYNVWKKSKDINRLAEAGEKLWNAFNMLVQDKWGKPIHNYGTLKKAVSDLYAKGKSNTILTTFDNAYKLHVFFYRGWTEDDAEIDELFIETQNGLKLLGGGLK